ncbi:MAG: hypothetical protein IJX90_12210 [Blautia sp.]|nr:hypothetical protein [Blautia sp.]
MIEIIDRQQVSDEAARDAYMEMRRYCLEHPMCVDCVFRRDAAGRKVCNWWKISPKTWPEIEINE